MIEIKIGDCTQRLKDLEDNSVDAVICDPPYGLKFMSKGWDDIGNGSQQREWHRAWLAEAHRVLKPNGVLKAFSGTRTFHHLIAMMGEIGFADLKVEAWAYGCLCEETEILTNKGWLKHQELDVGAMVVAYSLEEDHFDLQEVQEMLRYEYKDIAYRIYSDDTDQLVSKNHRCIVEREGERTFHLAEHLQAKEVVPFVEDMSVQEQSRPQALRGTWSTSTTLATITPQFYEGVVWCVRVPYGAFVARRNGKVFVTGNSGFPKSHNLAKQFEKKLGVEGEIIGHKPGVSVEDSQGHGGIARGGVGIVQKNAMIPIRALVSDEAKQWEGWGTALKPSFEPVVIGYKPK